MGFLDDLGIYYTDEGSGPSVLLLHGFASTHELWAEQAPLSEEFRLIAYDARGCGRSHAPQTGYSYAALAEEGLALLDALGVDSAHLVGHSRGGGIMLEMAFRAPQRVRSLFFMDSVLRGFPWSEEFLSAIGRASALCRERGVDAAMDEEWLQSPLYAWVRERRPEVFERVAAMTHHYSGAEWLRRERNEEPAVSDLERLQDVRHPTFVLSGQEDAHDFVEIANMLAWWIPGALQRSLLGVGHFPMLENPYETNLYLRGFLRRVEQGRGSLHQG